MNSMRAYNRQRRLMNLASSRTAVVGVPGNSPFFSGQMSTGEYLKTLDGQKGRLVYDEMRRSDNQVGAVLKQIVLPILSNKYRVDPPKDPKTKKIDPKDQEIAGIIEERLLNGLEETWQDTLRHALLMLPFGFSLQEKVWERDADGLIMPKALAERLPQSIIRWDIDITTREVKGPVQLDTDGHEYHLPMQKLLVYVSDREGDNYEGTSILRTAYKPWYIKDQLEKINAIKLDRMGVGVPRGKTPANITKDMQQYKDLQALLEAFYAQEQGYLITPEGYDVDILGTGGEKAGADALPTIKYYDECIARAALAQFIMLGQTQSGSRALGQTFYDAFTLALQAFANYICEVINRGLIPEWVDYNWKVERYPKLCAEKITDVDFTALAQLITSKAITPDLQMENSLRSKLNLPEREETDEGGDATEPDESSSEGADPGEAPATDEPQPENDEEAYAASDKKRHMHFVDKSKLAPEELIPDLDRIMLRLNDASVTLDKELLRIRDKQAEYLAQQLVGGRSLPNVVVPMKKDMFDAMRQVYKTQRESGFKDVMDESRKQRPDLKLSIRSEHLRATLADKKKPKSAQRMDLDTERMMLDVEGATSKLKSAMAQWTIDLKQSGLQGADLKAALMDKYNPMPTSTWDQMAEGATNRGWGLGRQEGFESIANEIDRCYYSAILDSALCSECYDTLRQPGSQDHVPDDPEFTTPNPNCLGAGRCRCMTIAVLKAETESKANQETQFGGPGSGRYPKGSGGEESDDSEWDPNAKGKPETTFKKRFQETKSFEQMQRLTPEEKNAFMAYRGSTYQLINANLRGKQMSGMYDQAKVQEYIDAMDSAFDKAPEIDTKIALYRGARVSDAEAASFAPGAVISDKGYISTSVSRKTAEGFKKHSSDTRTGVMFRIVATPGTKYYKLSGKGYEAEILLRRGTRMKIRSVEPLGTKSLYVVARIVK